MAEGGRAELEAIEVVCADDVPIKGCQDPPTTASADGSPHPAVGLARSEIRELLERLVEQSLVSVYMDSRCSTVLSVGKPSVVCFGSAGGERSGEGVDESARLARRHRYYYRDKLCCARKPNGLVPPNKSY